MRIQKRSGCSWSTLTLRMTIIQGERSKDDMGSRREQCMKAMGRVRGVRGGSGEPR